MHYSPSKQACCTLRAVVRNHCGLCHGVHLIRLAPAAAAAPQIHATARPSTPILLRRVACRCHGHTNGPRRQ